MLDDLLLGLDSLEVRNECLKIGPAGPIFCVLSLLQSNAELRGAHERVRYSDLLEVYTTAIG
jgi:hypothetical protein